MCIFFLSFVLLVEENHYKQNLSWRTTICTLSQWFCMQIIWRYFATWHSEDKDWDVFGGSCVTSGGWAEPDRSGLSSGLLDKYPDFYLCANHSTTNLFLYSDTHFLPICLFFMTEANSNYKRQFSHDLLVCRNYTSSEILNVSILNHQNI